MVFSGQTFEENWIMQFSAFSVENTGLHDSLWKVSQLKTNKINYWLLTITIDISLTLINDDNYNTSLDILQINSILSPYMKWIKANLFYTSEKLLENIIVPDVTFFSHAVI